MSSLCRPGCFLMVIMLMCRGNSFPAWLVEDPGPRGNNQSALSVKEYLA